MTAIRKHAVISADHKLHLDLDVPEDVPVGEVDLVLTIVPNRPSRERALDAIHALEEIAAAGNLARAIPDPSAWQREIREDRPLPGRE